MYEQPPQPDAVASILPQLDIDVRARAASVRRAALAALDEEAERRVNRFLWEGGFFMLVLIGGMSVLTAAIRHDRELRRRQQNFLAAVSHEFKSPLASIRLAAETLALRSQEELGQRLSERVLEDVERLLRMVDNLLDTARLEEGEDKVKLELILVQAAVQASVDEVRARAQQNGIVIGVEVEPDLELAVDSQCVRDRVAQSPRQRHQGLYRRRRAQHSRAGFQARRRHRAGGGRRRQGFPPEQAALMFQKFYRIGDELQRSTPGTGLGLYIVKRLVELSGAEVSASSAGHGRGATVSITWAAQRKP
jgi:signal transduction histidine kinase